MIFFRGIEIFGASIRRTAEISLRQWKINSVIGARARSKVIPALEYIIFQKKDIIIFDVVVSPENLSSPFNLINPV